MHPITRPIPSSAAILVMMAAAALGAGTVLTGSPVAAAPAVVIAATAHPKIGGVWIDPTACAGGTARITIIQSRSGNVTSVKDRLPGCAAAWTARNIRWTGKYVLAYDYVVSRSPSDWAPRGTHRITFAKNGNAAVLAWADSLGRSGTVAITRAGGG
jgi:hypothetical protein